MNLEGKSALVVGGSRGLGRGMALALARAGARTTAVARDSDALRELEREGLGIQAGDARQPELAGQLLDAHDPDIVVLAAGAIPLMRPFAQLDWETFSANWQLDTKATFHLLREAVLRPLRPGARVVVISSGAAVGGSPLSGGYASAKQAQRYLCAYARREIAQRELGFSVHCLLPTMNPHTRLGTVAVRGYARSAGLTPEAFAAQREQPLLTPESAGRSLVELLTSSEHDGLHEAMLTGAGLKPVG